MRNIIKRFSKVPAPEAFDNLPYKKKTTNKIIAGLTYSAKIAWTLDEALREFAQNLIDHASKEYGSFTTRVGQESQYIWTFVIEHNDEVVASITSTMSSTQEQVVRFSQLTGYISDTCFYIYSNKSSTQGKQKNKGKQMGGFGEGFKAASHVLIKRFEADILFTCGDAISKFCFEENPEHPDDEGARPLMAKTLAGFTQKYEQQGVQFEVRLPSQSTKYTFAMFQRTVLRAQPEHKFVAMGPSLSICASLDPLSPSLIYVGGLFVREEPRLPGFTFNVDPSAVRMQRDRNEFKLKNHTTFEDFLVAEICEVVRLTPKLCEEAWTSAWMEHLWSHIQRPENLEALCRAKFGRPASTVVMVASLMHDEAWDDSRLQAGLLLVPTNGKVPVDCHHLPHVLSVLVNQLSIIVDVKASSFTQKYADDKQVQLALQLLGVCTNRKPNMNTAFSSSGKPLQVPAFCDVPAGLAEAIVLAPGGVWDEAKQYVPVSVLGDEDRVRVLVNNACIRLGYPRLQFWEFTVAALTSAFDVMDHDQASKNNLFDEFLRRKAKVKAGSLVSKAVAKPVPVVPVVPVPDPVPLRRQDDEDPDECEEAMTHRRPHTEGAGGQPAQHVPSLPSDFAQFVSNLANLSNSTVQQAQPAEQPPQQQQQQQQYPAARSAEEMHQLARQRQSGPAVHDPYDHQPNPEEGSIKFKTCAKICLTDATRQVTPRRYEVHVPKGETFDEQAQATVDKLLFDDEVIRAIKHLDRVEFADFALTVDGISIPDARNSRSLSLKYFWHPHCTTYGFTPGNNSGTIWLNLGLLCLDPFPTKHFASTLHHEFAHVVLDAYGYKGRHGDQFVQVLHQVAFFPQFYPQVCPQVCPQ
jgi:hypothetical protein